LFGQKRITSLVEGALVEGAKVKNRNMSQPGAKAALIQRQISVDFPATPIRQNAHALLVGLELE
jgi:hypothetical protein